MAYFLGVYLMANSFSETPNTIHVQVFESAGADISTYEIPLPHVAAMSDAADDQWLRDVFVAAIEAL